MTRRQKILNSLLPVKLATLDPDHMKEKTLVGPDTPIVLFTDFRDAHVTIHNQGFPDALIMRHIRIPLWEFLIEFDLGNALDNATVWKFLRL